ncbi:hypothetical protein H0H87_003934 [Tephrocybe sp. NHM501043]|nr:hypothetical protein H0H87_003934 [Tephrocybe sp. NHM501043]
MTPLDKQLIGLPPEILTEILIELYREGMVDTGLTKLSPLERLNLLRGRRKAWAQLRWKTASVVPLNGLCHAYELVGGIFAHGDSHGDGFVTTTLQSSVRPGHQSLRENLQLFPRDFAIDPGQDLVIYIEADGTPMLFEDAQVFRLHVRSMSTQEAHPKARTPVLPVVVPPNSTYGTFVRGITLQVADDIVAVMLYTGHEQLVIFNWRDGTLITDSAKGDHALGRETEFAFISPRAYILTSPRGHGCIEIYSFKSQEGFDPIPVATLILPELHADARFQTISPHTGPFETPSSNAPFATSPTSRVYVITLSVLYDRARLAIEPQSEIFYLFVKASTFLSYLEVYGPGISPWETIVVPWALWGPSHTRLLPSLPSYSSWLRYVYFSMDTIKLVTHLFE